MSKVEMQVDDLSLTIVSVLVSGQCVETFLWA